MFSPGACTSRPAFRPLLLGLLILCCSSAGRSLSVEAPPSAARAVEKFQAALKTGSLDALLPTLTRWDRLAILERRERGLGLFRVEDLHRLFLQAPTRRATGGADAAPAITLLADDRARADLAPLLSFRPSLHLLKEDGRWKVDLTGTLRAANGPRPREEVVSICRRALHGIADDADLLETEHFLIFARTGPVPAQRTARLLEELYRDFQEVFPFDLGAHLQAGTTRPAIPGPDPYMVVFLFSSRDTYRRFIARHDPGARSGKGYATPTGYFVTWLHRTYATVVRHEGAHLLMYRRMHLFGAPNWLAEGIAETMRDPRDVAVRKTRLRRLLLGGKQISLKPVMLKEKIDPGTDYQVAHSLVHFLRKGRGKEWAEFIRFVRTLPPGPRPKECREELLRLLGMDQAELDAAWRNFILSLRSPPAGE